METLESLAKFVEKYPHQIEGDLQYAFLGGTAIRLHQESIGMGGSLKRPISDFDLLVFGDNTYPVHNCKPNDVWGVVSMNGKSLQQYVEEVNFGDSRFYVMDGDFLALTKTCAIDHPREKDFEDLRFLYKNKKIDLNRLNGLFGNALRLTQNSDLATNSFSWLMEGGDTKIRLFQSFPNFVNLIDEFANSYLAREIIENYVIRDRSKNGHQLNSVVYDTHAVVKEIPRMVEEDKFLFLDGLLSLAEISDYIDYDRIVHEDIVNRIRYASSDEDRKNILDEIYLSALSST